MHDLVFTATYRNILDIELEFLKEVTELSSFFKPENIVVKKLNGKEVTCSQMVSMLSSYWKTLNDENLKGPENILKVRHYGISVSYNTMVFSMFNMRFQFNRIYCKT